MKEKQILTDNLASNGLEINKEEIDGAEVIIIGSDNNTTFKLNAIQIDMTAQDDYYVPANGKLSEAISAAGEDKEVLFTNNWDIEYKGLTTKKTHDLKLSTSSDRKYNLVWYDGDNKKVNMPLAYAYDNTHIQFSEDLDGKALILKEGIPIKKNDYFVLTGGTPEEGTAKSYLLRYMGADKVTRTSPRILFKDIGSGNIIERQVSNGDEVCTIKLGGNSFIVKNASDMGSDDFDVFVDLDTTFKADENKSVADPVIGTLLEGESKDYYLGSKKYTIKLVYTDNTYAKFTVNGKVTTKLITGEVYTLDDSNKLTVTEVLYQSFAGGVHSATFNLTENPVIEGYSHLGIGEEQVPIIDNYGAQIIIGNQTQRLELLDSTSLTISTPNPDDYDNQKPSEIKLTIGATETNEVTVSSFGIDEVTNPLLTPEGEIGVYYGYTSMGGKLTYNTPVGSPSLFTYEYSEKQRLPQVYILGKTEYITKPALELKVTTNLNAGCEYKVGEDSDYQGMETINGTIHGGTSHYENMFDLKEDDYNEVFVQCEDELGNITTKSVTFYLGEKDLGGYVCPPYSEGIVVNKIDFTKQSAVPDNTYENGWKFNFFITVPENESTLSMWIDDWVNEDDILQTDGNVKITYDGKDHAVGNAHDYSGSGSFVAMDKYPDCPGRQIEFEVLVKLPENTNYGYYSTSYGIRSLPAEGEE